MPSKNLTFKVVVFLFIGCLLPTNLFCQQAAPKVISTSGIEYQDENLIFSSTIGEVIIGNLENTDPLLTQGFHQPQLILTPLNNLSDHPFDVKLFPNPTAAKVAITISDISCEELGLQLFNAQGQVLIDKSINCNSQKQELDLTPFADGIYFLSVSDKKGLLQRSYKIQKTNN